MKKDYFLKIFISLVGIYCILTSVIGIGIDSGLIYKFFSNFAICGSVLPHLLERTIIVSSLVISFIMGIIFLMSVWVENGNHANHSEPQQ